MDSPPILFRSGQRAGAGYIAAMELYGRYAYAQPRHRRLKALETRRRRGARVLTTNSPGKVFVRTTTGSSASCTPRAAGGGGRPDGHIGHPEGVGSPRRPGSLFSTVHGAGRVMSRTQTTGRAPPEAVRVHGSRLRSGLRHRRRELGGGRRESGVCLSPRCGPQEVWSRSPDLAGPSSTVPVQARLREQGIVLVGGGATAAPRSPSACPGAAAHGDSVT